MLSAAGRRRIVAHMTSATKIYAPADAAIRRMNRKNLKLFDRLRLMKADELNVIRKVVDTYDESAKYARHCYYEIAFDAFVVAMIQAHRPNREATKAANRWISLDWIDEMLEETDFVTLYRFNNEVERKAHRLAEALTATENRNEEIDKALRYWTLQVGQYAINVTDRARLLAFKKAGIEKVRWNTEKDERVCNECAPLDGKVFDIDDVPPKRHINCRCWLSIVFDD